MPIFTIFVAIATKCNGEIFICNGENLDNPPKSIFMPQKCFTKISTSFSVLITNKKWPRSLNSKIFAFSNFSKLQNYLTYPLSSMKTKRLTCLHNLEFLMIWWIIELISPLSEPILKIIFFCKLGRIFYNVQACRNSVLTCKFCMTCKFQDIQLM